MAALAASGALMAMVREQDAALVVIPAVDYLWTRVRGRDWTMAEGVARLGVAAAVFAIGMLPQLLAYRTLNGRFGPAKVIADKMDWTAPCAFAGDVLPGARLVRLDAACARRNRRPRLAGAWRVAAAKNEVRSGRRVAPRGGRHRGVCHRQPEELDAGWAHSVSGVSPASRVCLIAGLAVLLARRSAAPVRDARSSPRRR